MNLSDYYKVEGLLRGAEGRSFYLINDNRRDRQTRRCWDCGDESTPLDAPTCVSCGAALQIRRFLLSVHHTTAAEAYFQFFQRQLVHRAFVGPCDAFLFPENRPVQLCSVVPYHGERFLLDEASPMPIEQVLNLAQRGIALMAWLASQGIKLSYLSRANFLVRGVDDFLLFDPEITEVTEQPVAPTEYAKVVADLGSILRKYTPVEHRAWQDFFQGAEDGMYMTPEEFGVALQAEYQKHPTLRTTLHAGMSDVGLVRQLNEDNWGWARLITPPARTSGGEQAKAQALPMSADIFVVADGMGGHDRGEVASKVAVDTIIAESHRRMAWALKNASKPGTNGIPSIDAIENLLDESFQEANNRVKGMGEEQGSDMGTTLVACIVITTAPQATPDGASSGITALCANVGDSRAYLLRGGQLHQITRDHSLVQQMVERNKLTPSEARNHPHSNILLRTVGNERNVEIDIFRVELEVGDRILLCTDGLWGEVEDAEIESILNHSDNNRIVSRELIRAAHQGGGKDNISVVIANIPGESDSAVTTSEAT